MLGEPAPLGELCEEPGEELGEPGLCELGVLGEPGELGLWELGVLGEPEELGLWELDGGELDGGELDGGELDGGELDGGGGLLDAQPPSINTPTTTSDSPKFRHIGLPTPVSSIHHSKSTARTAATADPSAYKLNLCCTDHGPEPAVESATVI